MQPGAHSVTLSLAAVALSLTLCGAPTRAAEPASSIADVHLERGWRLPGTGFTLGGYVTEDFTKRKRAPWKLTTEDLSLFIGWEGTGKLKFFSELGLEDALVIEQSGKVSAGNHSPAFERIYVDYAHSEPLNFRLGKFLTPVGRWNLIHADPLVWTTSRPLITERPFPTYTTGAMIYGTGTAGGKEIDYSFYAANGPEIRADPKQDSFDSAYGLHLSCLSRRLGQIGFSYTDFTQKSTSGERKHLFGIDYLWSRDRYELSSEAIYRLSSRGHAWSEKGIFVQAVAPLSAKLYGVGRYEYFDPAGASPGVNLWLAGLAFRITPTAVLKAEFIHGVNNDIRAREGFFSSISLLF